MAQLSDSPFTTFNEGSEDAEIVVMASRLREGAGGGSSGLLNQDRLLLLSETGLATSYGPQLEFLPNFLEGLFRDATKISSEDRFTPHQKTMITEAISKLSKIEPIASEWKAFLELKMDIDFHVGDRSDEVSDDSLGAMVGIPGYGANIEIYIAEEYGQEPLSDDVFIETVIHELVHAFGKTDWDQKLHNEDWDKALRLLAYADPSTSRKAG